ncbi:uncharacterized protein LOC106666240 [Cimex lectularius]|uniref:Uncharacterized protein n=1 Tax=Cimex lectularius TaxID=79782 RepID=A0A8I6RPK6_CIMLE|nr:uncharacterized protein LOC106666240 [Cimex lectularius]
MQMYLNYITSFLFILIYSVECLYVKIECNGPIVVGGTITFIAQLYDDSGFDSEYEFDWRDNAVMHSHEASLVGRSHSIWNVTYDKDKYAPGEYEVTVVVKKKILIPWRRTSARISFNLTSYMNGHIDVTQGNVLLKGDNINIKTEVEHQVTLNEADEKLLIPNQTIINTYWFSDCKYMGVQNGLTFSYNYTKDDADRPIEIETWLIVGPESNSTNASTTLFNRSTNEIENVTITNLTTTTVPSVKALKDCKDDSILIMDPKKYYGKFKRNIIPTWPVSIGNVEGSTWLKNGELLELNVTCSGSSPFYHCVRFIKGEYNSTGNETCANARQTQSCKIAVTRLLSAGSRYTVLFIIGNKVSNAVKPVGVNMYYEPKHPQLSVIIVPVTCTSIAVVLIIFGFAYYIQSKNRHTIEIADFDFARRNDSEYMTFKERLRDAIGSAFTRVHEEYSEEGPIGNVWSPTRKNHPRQGLLSESDSETLDT